MSINNKILKYLQDKKISQVELAKRTNILPQNLNRLLNADDIKLSQLIAITKALDLPLTYFFEGNENVSTEKKQEFKKSNTELQHKLSANVTILNACYPIVSKMAVETRNFMMTNVLKDFIEYVGYTKEQVFEFLVHTEKGLESIEYFLSSIIDNPAEKPNTERTIPKK